ncbi:MAG: hypothetical protein KDE03_13350 [Rhodobacteraceae bacterium]|nr:hypothetical protein [Paracoccaceae bacterium]
MRPAAPLRLAAYLAAAVTGGVMLVHTMPELRQLAAGQPPFDLRWYGYGADEARGYLMALGTTGRDYYLTVQLRIDTVFPSLAFLAAMAAITGLATGWRRSLLIGIAACETVVDYLENAAIAAMLRAGPDMPDPGQAERAGMLTQMKFLLVLAVALPLGAMILSRWRRRTGQPT